METVMSDVTGRFKFGSAIAGAVIGFEAGLFGVLDLACVLWPKSDLCGLPAVFTAASLGAVAGGALGWRIAPSLGPLMSALERTVRAGTVAGSAFLFTTAALTGLWTAFLLDGHRDYQNWYWGLMLPLLVGQSALFGHLAPKRAWLWGAAPLFGQWLWQVMAHGDQIGIGNLGPFAHLVVLGQYALTAIPCVIAAETAAHVSRRPSADAKT
jgi:hypothetical protein